MTVTLRIRRLPGADPAVPLPAYASAGAAAMDIRANLDAADRARGLVLAPGARALVPTGFAVELPAGHELQIRPRSGLALARGITLLNAPGTVDEDFRGEVGVIAVNLGSETVTIEHGMRIAQMLVAPVPRIALDVVETLGESARGTGGFGSTGAG
jgi:dUTP pyrophosphatase